MGKPFITAHAGFEGTAENSEESLRAVLSLSPDAIEADVRRTENGTLVLSHEAGGKADSCCTLEKMMRITGTAPKLKINCDLKEPGLEPEVLRLGREVGVLGKIILTGNVRPEAVDFLQKSVQVYLNLECLKQKLEGKNLPDRRRRTPITGEEMDRLFRKAKQYRIQVLNLPYRFFSDSFFARASEMGIGLSLWTVDSVPLLRELIAKAPLNITTRKVRAALRIRDGALGNRKSVKEGKT